MANVADTLTEVLSIRTRRAGSFAADERSIVQWIFICVLSTPGKGIHQSFWRRATLLGLPPAVNAVLGGNIGNSFAIRWRMGLYFLVWLQKYYLIGPRLTLGKKKKLAVTLSRIRVKTTMQRARRRHLLGFRGTAHVCSIGFFVIIIALSIVDLTSWTITRYQFAEPAGIGTCAADNFYIARRQRRSSAM
jgi:hypothetical protein